MKKVFITGIGNIQLRRAAVKSIRADDGSMGDMMPWIVFQPYVVAYFLSVANNNRESKPSGKPTTIRAIISFLGLDYLAGLLDSDEIFVDSIAPEDRIAASESYVLANMYAGLVAIRLGRIGLNISVFFLVGLLSNLFKEDKNLLNNCHEDIIRLYEGKWEDVPTLEEAEYFIGIFRYLSERKVGYMPDGLGIYDQLYQTWCMAQRRAAQYFNL